MTIRYDETKLQALITKVRAVVDALELRTAGQQ